MVLSLHAGQATARAIDGVHAWAAAHDHLHIDLGTGDGAYALSLARRDPALGVIGLDTVLDHLRGSRRRHPCNLRFVTADALTLPLGMLPAACTVTINFPFGSLLLGLIAGEQALVERLDALLAPEGRLEIRVNHSALEAHRLDPASAQADIARTLKRIDVLRVSRREMDQAELRRVPSSWAKRLGYGRPAGAWLIEATRGENRTTMAPGNGRQPIGIGGMR